VLRTRLLTVIVLTPIVVWLIYLGGLPFLALIAVLATVAEVEFCLLVASSGFRPAHLFGIALVWLFLLDGAVPRWGLLMPSLAVVFCTSLAWQVLEYPRSRLETWTGVVASGVYVGLCASFLIRLRELPGDGLWWTLIAVPASLFADGAAYVAGSVWGRRKLAPSLSLGKTWEGYAGGIAVGSLMAALLAWVWSHRVGPGSAVTGFRGLVLGILISTLTPMGDLAVSMIKREAGVEDSGRLLPGHGGALDRLDSILWTAVIAYCYATWVVR
jgi:phosphatidate cytidylyltransferase